MKNPFKKFSPFFILLFGALALFSQSTDTATMSRVQKFLSMRNKNPAYIDTCIVLLDDYLKTARETTGARVLLSEICLKKGNRETDNRQKLYWFHRGEEQAQLALAKDSTNGRAKLWEISNLSMSVRVKGILSSLTSIPRIKEGIARALQLDPTYPKAYAAQGIIYAELPSFLGGNLDSSLAYFERGLKLEPNYAGIYVKMARVYALKKEYQTARDLFNKVLAMKNPSDPAEYDLVNRPEALEQLDKIRDK